MNTKILKYLPYILIACLLIIIALSISTCNSCKDEIPESRVVLRDSSLQDQVDSLESVNYHLQQDLNQYNFLVDSEKNEIKINQKIFQVKKNEIKKNNPDSIYIDVLRYLDEYNF